MFNIFKYLEGQSSDSVRYGDAHDNVTTQFTFACAAATLFITLLLPFLSNIPLIVTLLGVFISGFLFILWFLFKEGVLIKHSANILLIVSKLILLPKILITGSLYSELIPVALILPFIFMLLGGFNHALTVISFWAITWLILCFIGPIPFNLTETTWNEGKAASITLWLVATSILSLMVIIKIENINRRQKKYLMQIANSDALTDVYNRRGLSELLQNEIEYCSRTKRELSILFLDIDHFKRYNDNNGHAKGDAALKKVAACLKENTRVGQDIVARFGGEEFVVILRETSQDEAYSIAEKIRIKIKDLGIFYEATQSDRLSITIGLYTTNCINESEKSIIKKADQALYFGKENGRDQVVIKQ